LTRDSRRELTASGGYSSSRSAAKNLWWRSAI
jgi:hypothetical protein